MDASLIGLFIIIMACIYFINLSTAQAVKSLKEIGIKKVLGSNKWTIVFWQMMGETALLFSTAIAFAVNLCCICLPYVQTYCFDH
jgi:hypothetical protein